MNLNFCITCGTPINSSSESTLSSMCYSCRANHIPDNLSKSWHDSSLVKKLSEMEERSASNYLRELGESSVSKQLREMEESSVLKIARDLDGSIAARYLRDMGESTFLKELQTPDNSSFLNDINGFRSVSDYLANLVTPSVIPASSLSVETWQNTLFDRLGRLKVDWLDQDPIRSIAGFSHLARLSDFIDINEPFSKQVVELLNSELGEPRVGSGSMAQEASNGFNLDIAAFDDDHYSEVIEIAGFEIDLSKFDTSAYSTDQGTVVNFCNNSSYLMQVLENSLDLLYQK